MKAKDAQAKDAKTLPVNRMWMWLQGILAAGVIPVLGWLITLNSTIAVQTEQIATLQRQVVTHEQMDTTRAQVCQNGRHQIEISLKGLSVTLGTIKERLHDLLESR